MRLVTALAACAALFAGHASASAQAPAGPGYTPANPDYIPAAPPYNIPTAPPATNPGVSLPLVAALTLPRGQKLGVVLHQGLWLRVYAYKPIQFSVLATLTRVTARRVHLPPGLLAIPRRVFRFDQPGIYQRRVRLSHRVVTRLRGVKHVHLQLRTALSSAGNRTSTTSPVTLAR